MGGVLENLFMTTGVGNGLLRGLADFSSQSGHPEIEYVPLFFDGHSWGGQFGYHFAFWRSQQTLGFVTIKGGVHLTSFAGSTMQISG